MKDEQVTVSRDLLVRADSYLSLLWHRPSTPHDTDLQRQVPTTIGELRTASERRSLVTVSRCHTEPPRNGYVSPLREALDCLEYALERTAPTPETREQVEKAVALINVYPNILNHESWPLRAASRRSRPNEA